ncbi:hypothetical protein [Pseudomonas gingeri]|uniref:hypothetical protein n=1 Tax=Pseudomonas gingeri TaxID=117681 RepID=UPI001FEA9102|nr:hypothetical protein [Pseudomonas gingeri]
MMVGNDDKTGIWKQNLAPENPDAIGSGAQYAIAAMDRGVSAEDTVRVAMKWDICTGGAVSTVIIELVTAG